MQMPKNNQVEDEFDEHEPTAEETAAALAEQMAGFKEAVTTTTPTKTETAQAAEAAQAEELKAQQEREAAEAVAKTAQEAEAAAKAEADAKAAKPILAGYTEAQVSELLKKAAQADKLQSELNKAFGKLGGFEQQLKALAESRGTPSQMTAEDVAEYAQEYGQEAADALLKIMNRFATKQGGAVADPSKAAAPKVEEVIANLKTEFATELSTATGKVKEDLTKTMNQQVLDLTHKDWPQLVRAYDAEGKDVGLNPKFQAWVATLSTDDQDKLLNGYDAKFVSGKLTVYKEHLAKVEAEEKKAADAAKLAAEKAAKGHTPNRLQAAVIPKGIPGQPTTKSALQEQMEGYASA
jgi:hypothetical protein